MLSITVTLVFFMKKDLIELGKSLKPHGIKGAFQFILHNPQDSALKDKLKIILYPLSESSSISIEGEEHEIRSIHFGNKTICYLKGIDDRNLTEQMLPFNFYINSEDLPKLDEDEFYLKDLIGLDVLNSEGQKIGTVVRLYDNGAQPVLKINLENESIELPFVEVFFPELNLENKTITMIRPEVIE